ncbi:MAG: carboxypeptidase regulatory-like domain-containing protein [Acidobacteria bacterium]|nr:carboxypeptidase regulatory-like domain-containing protein [Acidobacteriota bacterium]
MRSRLAWLALAAAFCATAQTTTGTVKGLVTDPAGAFVAQASVKLSNVNTGLVQSTETSDSGNYVFPLVQPGSYQIDVEKPGFQRFARTFTLEVTQQARVDAQLAVGQVSETVNVSASSVVLETDTSNLGQVITNRQVADLPLNGRNPFALAALTPGVTPLASFGSGLAGARGAAQAAGANNFLANGGMTGANEILLDGIPITVCCQGQPALIPTIDTTEEFKVQTNTSPAEFGRTSGAILNIVTKSGTNRLRGTAYEFLRNEKLDATNFFINRAGTNPIPGRQDRRTPLRYNQFGAAVGGPVNLGRVYNGKDRTFFFANYEGVKLRRSLFRTFSIPTPLMRTGNLTEAPFDIYDPATTTPNANLPGRYLRTPFAGRAIPAARMNVVSQNILKLYPQPQRSGIVNNYDAVASSRDDDKQYSVRIDHNFSERYRLFGRYSGLWNDHYEPNYWNSVSSPAGFNQFIKSHTVVLDQIAAIRPTFVLNFRYGFARQRNFRDPYSLGSDLGALGFSPLYVSQVQERFLPAIGITGFNGNDETGNQRFTRYSHTLAVAVSVVRSKHSMKSGWDGRVLIDHNASLGNPGGNFSFASTFTSGPDPVAGVPGGQAPYLGFGTFLLGLPTSGLLTFSDATSQQGFYHALYFQDDWKITQKLTLNLGIRWEIETGPTERYNRIATVEPAIDSPLAKQTGLPLKGGLEFRGVNGASRGRYRTDGNNIGPRLGFAYSLDSKTVFRGGLGLFFAPGLVRLFNGGNPGFSVTTPFVATIDGVTPAGILTNPFPTGLQPLAGSSLGAATLVGTGISALTYDTPLPYSTQWNFGIQRELPGALAINVFYAGNRGVKLPINTGLNGINPILYGQPGDLNRVAQLNALVNNPFFGAISSGTLAARQVQQNQLLRAYPHFTGFGINFLGAGNSTYHALQVSAQKRMTHGLLATLSYTFSKNLGDVNMLTTSFFDAGQNPGYQNEFNHALDRSVLGSDFPHRFVLSAVYDLPFGKGRKLGASAPKWANAAIGGWQVNGIYTFQSGQPLNFGVSGTPAYAGSRASYTGAAEAVTGGGVTSRLGGVSGGSGYLNAAAFRVPVSFEFGNTPRLDSRVRGPVTVNLDFSLIKSFPLAERLRLQFRAEAFNLTNTPVFGLPNTTVGNPGFGVIGGQANSPRNLQMALKLIW